MIVPRELVFNYLIELKRKEINPVDRAELIKKYCQESKLSVRGLAKELDVPHSTLQDWVDYGNINKEEYKSLLDKGVSKKNIHRILRSNRKYTDLSYITSIDLNLRLEECKSTLRDFINNGEFNQYTLRLISDLKNILSRIEIRIELNNRKKIKV